MEYKLMDKLVLRLVRKQIGLENSNIFPTAGATVSPEVERFVHSVGINMVVGYGLTESLATVSCDRDNMPYTIGSVGRPIKGIEVRVSGTTEGISGVRPSHVATTSATLQTQPPSPRTDSSARETPAT